MTSFVIKIIAALTMFIDHMGLMLFPHMDIFRIIGRLAFPIYAYCIAEGFRYTRNRLKYFLQIFILGVLCQIVYTIVDGVLYLGILITFSISLVIMYFIDCLKSAAEGKESHIAKLYFSLFKRKLSGRVDLIISAILSAITIAAAYLLTRYIEVDYGFFGILLPVFAAFFDDKPRRLIAFSACLVALCLVNTSAGDLLQYWSLLAVPILAVYNGKRGKYRLKYFFYIFYPAHLVLLYAIDYFIM